MSMRFPKCRGISAGLTLLAGLLSCALRAEPAGVPPILQALKDIALPLEGNLTVLTDALRDQRVVLLGEASHGTSEYYRLRAEISQRLIAEHGFRFVAVEGDWKAIHQLHRYVMHESHPEGGARGIMLGFHRWPEWMWANEETEALVEWMRAHNAPLPPEARAGMHGIDVYGFEPLFEALPALAATLDETLAGDLRRRLECFAPYAADMGGYARAAARGFAPCQAAIGAVLESVRERHQELPGFEGFHFKQMAWVLQNAESHYRTMPRGGATSWNHRAQHFFDTVRRLMEYHGDGAKGIVWAHNTHIGDARATDMARAGQVNIGELARRHWGRDHVALVGFGTDRGTLIAGRQWGARRELMRKPPAPAGTLEHWMRQIGPGDWLLRLRGGAEILQAPLGHRAAGVVYHPLREVPGNYVPTRLTERYDFFLFLEETQALRPLHPDGELPR